MNYTKIRAVLSSILGLDFLIVAITGIGLWRAPIGRIANATAWTFMGFSKHQLEKIHTLTGFIMLFLVLLHVVLNFRMFKNENKLLYKKKAKKAKTEGKAKKAKNGEK